MSTLRVIDVEPTVTVLPDVWGKNVYGVGRSTRAVLEIGEQIVSSAIFIKVPAHVRSRVDKERKSFLLGGIGVVLTPPQHRGKGYATQLLENSLEYMSREWGIQGGVLFCAGSHRVWCDRRGWKRATGFVVVNQPDRQMPVPLKVNTMVYGFDNDVDMVLESLPW